MNDNRKQTLKQLSALFESQNLAVLSTQKNKQPYSSLIAFAATSDCKYFYFLTPSTTRKYENLNENPKVSFLVNDSQNQADDIYNAVSVTGTGVASVLDKTEKLDALGLFLKKHPHLSEFADAPTTAFICIKVKRYFFVNRFQNVVELTVQA